VEKVSSNAAIPGILRKSSHACWSFFFDLLITEKVSVTCI
jgi:hypothetical protein